MKFLIAVSLLVAALFISFPGDARSRKTPTEDEIRRTLQTVTRQEKALRREVNDLQVELNKVKTRKHAEQKKSTANTLARPGALEEDIDLDHAPYGYFGALRFRHGITITTSPLLGLKSAFNASDLLYEYPSMNEDLLLLRQRQYFELHLLEVGDTLDNRAIVVLSGALEGQIIHRRDFDHRTRGDVNLTTAELDIMPMFSTWANGLIVLDYDDSPPATGSRVTNARIYLSRGFLTIGNLAVSPLYFTLGQMYVPFGKYGSAMLTTPLTKSLARIEARAAVLGYYHQGFYTSVYGFQGSKTSGSDHVFRQGGLNSGYQNGGFDIGAGYVTNIADSEGMQDNGIPPFVTTFLPENIRRDVLTQFGGFGETPSGNNLQHSVPALNGHMEFSHGPLGVLLEYITAVRSFAPQDVTFNGAGAFIRVMHAEIDFTTHYHNKPILFGFAYGQTWQALAFNLPKNSYSFVISTSIWKNTMAGIEFRYDVNYGRTALASTTGSSLPVPPANIGGHRNMITLQFGAYF
ncbi:LbtU family siderophore porin [Coxiella burnetii]|uniref:LbtU family siderophore porin n=1 Tax=Coxiella burnetii TaxID=777 RepID=UPI0022322A12|nr:LbtU family siderophore porin [Coxiella burnetii]